METTAVKPGPSVDDRMNALIAAGPEKILQLLLWKNRFREPELQIQITERDLNGFEDCLNYLKVEAGIRIFRPGGRPAIPERPATKTKSALPAREAIPPKPIVQVNLVEKGTVNTIRPVENNEEDYERQARASEVARTRDRITQLAGIVHNAAARGEFSQSEVIEICRGAQLLARELT